MTGLTQEQVHDIAEQVADAAFKKFFLAFGADASDPDSILKMQKDFAHLRAWRESIDLVKNKGLSAAVWFIVTGVLGGLVLFFSARHP
jgi:hypothetical protein